MLAYGGGSAPAASAGEYPAWTLRTSGHNKGSGMFLLQFLELDMHMVNG